MGYRLSAALAGALFVSAACGGGGNASGASGTTGGAPTGGTSGGTSSGGSSTGAPWMAAPLARRTPTAAAESAAPMAAATAATPPAQRATRCAAATGCDDTGACLYLRTRQSHAEQASAAPETASPRRHATARAPASRVPTPSARGTSGAMAPALPATRSAAIRRTVLLGLLLQRQRLRRADGGGPLHRGRRLLHGCVWALGRRPLLRKHDALHERGRHLRRHRLQRR